MKLVVFAVDEISQSNTIGTLNFVGGKRLGREREDGGKDYM